MSRRSKFRVSGTCIAADNLSVVTNLALYGVSLLIWHQFCVVSMSAQFLDRLSLGESGRAIAEEKKSVVCVFDVGLSLGILR